MYDYSAAAAYTLAASSAALPAIQSTAYSTTYTEDPSSDHSKGGGDIDYSYVPWGNITGNIEDQKDLADALHQLQDEIDDIIDTHISNIFTYKGQVDTYNDLPTEDNKIGDCYNVINTGANYVWNGEDWDKLSETFDFSIYVTKDELAEEIGQLQELFYTKAQIESLLSNLEYVIDQKIAEKVDLSAFNDFEDEISDTLAHQDGNIQTLQLRMEELDSKITDLKSLDYEVVVCYDGGDTEFFNREKTFQLSGAITSNCIIVGENIELKDATILSSYCDFTVSEDITIRDNTLTGTIRKSDSTALFHLFGDGYITMRDCNISPDNAYNGLEIAKSKSVPNSVTIDNVRFGGKLTNDGICIYGMEDGGVVTISNCYFKDLYNIIKICNRTNTTWTLNLINCVCDKWEVGEYGGAIHLHDTISTSVEEADELNMFSNLTINIQNLTKPDGTKLVKPENIADICGTHNSNQIIYMWDDYRLDTDYCDKYPTINII